MLIGNKVILRPLKIGDLEKTHQWRNNLELLKLTQGIRFPKTLEMDKEWFEHALKDKSNRSVFFGLDELETGEFIGMYQLNNIDYISGTAIWGYIIGETNKRGKGYGIEASNLILKYAFNVLNLRKITTYNISYNNAALAIQNKIGVFKKEGELKKHIYFDREYHDVLVLSLFREDFKEIKY